MAADPGARRLRLPGSSSLSRRGEEVVSRPIKGTAANAGSRAPARIRAENVMIVDLVRNDLGAVAARGPVSVPEFLSLEAHPGCASGSGEGAAPVGGRLAEILAATFPPGSVTGAPKSSALNIIDQLEPVPRGPYCGADPGRSDADAGTAELPSVSAPSGSTATVTVQDMAARRATIRLGPAPVSPGSDAAGEWRETELGGAPDRGGRS